MQRTQAELQSEAEAPAEGEDAVVEEAAVTGGILKPCLSVLDRDLSAQSRQYISICSHLCCLLSTVKRSI